MTPPEDPKPARRSLMDAAFDSAQFHTDLMNAARQLGVTTMPGVAKDAGVRVWAIQRLKRGLPPDLPTILVLCDWAGINPVRYLVRTGRPAANDAQGRAAA